MAVLVLALCGPAAQLIRAADEAQSADDWRRTARGWERTQSWVEPTNKGRPPDRFIFDEESRKSVPRWDFHPASLVGLQLVTVTLGFALWAVPATAKKFKDADNEDMASLNLRPSRQKAA